MVLKIIIFCFFGYFVYFSTDLMLMRFRGMFGLFTAQMLPVVPTAHCCCRNKLIKPIIMKKETQRIINIARLKDPVCNTDSKLQLSNRFNTLAEIGKMFHNVNDALTATKKSTTTALS